MKSHSFQNGDPFPTIGLGTWKAAPGEVGNAIFAAIKAGYRHFDCAPVYGNEKEIGRAFAAAFSDGLVKRSEIHITSKLWCDAHQQEHVLPALRKTLADLQLDYLDLFLIHWPVALTHGTLFPESRADFLTISEAPLTETWQAMESCHAQGLCRHIGVSNFSPARLTALSKFATRPPEVNQVECHPFLNQSRLLTTCHDLGVILTCYSPLGSGKEKSSSTDIFQNETIKKIATARSATPAQITLAWEIARGTVTIPKSTNPARLAENLAAADLNLSPLEIASIDSLDQNHRFIDGSIWTEDGSPYSLDWLWEGDAIE